MNVITASEPELKMAIREVLSEVLLQDKLQSERSLTKLEAANYLNISLRTLDDRKEEIGFIKDGVIRFLKSDLDQYRLKNRIKKSA